MILIIYDNTNHDKCGQDGEVHPRKSYGTWHDTLSNAPKGNGTGATGSKNPRAY